MIWRYYSKTDSGSIRKNFHVQQVFTVKGVGGLTESI